MTQTEREALEALRQKATPLPWSTGPRLHYDMFASVLGSDGHLIVNLGDGGNGIDRQTANGEVIVAAVNALPALLADSKALELAAVQVEHERARAERLEQALREVEQRIREGAGPIAALVNAHGGTAERHAYKTIYSAAIHAQGALGEVKP